MHGMQKKTKQRNWFSSSRRAVKYGSDRAKRQLAHALISGRGVIIKSGAAWAAPAAPTPTALLRGLCAQHTCMPGSLF